MPLPLMIGIAQATVEAGSWIYASYTGLGILAGAGTVYGGLKIQEYWKPSGSYLAHLNQQYSTIKNLSESLIDGLQKIDLNIQDLLVTIQKLNLIEEILEPTEIEKNLHFIIKKINEIQNTCEELKSLGLEENNLNQKIIDKVSHLNKFLKSENINLIQVNQKLFLQNKTLVEENNSKDKIINHFFKLVNQSTTDNTEKIKLQP